MNDMTLEQLCQQREAYLSSIRLIRSKFADMKAVCKARAVKTLENIQSSLDLIDDAIDAKKTADKIAARQSEREEMAARIREMADAL